MKLLFRLWNHLEPRRRKQAVAVLLLMLFGGFAEVLSIGAVIPFVTVLVSPERVLQFGPVATLAQMLGVVRPEDLVLPLTIAFVVGALLAGAIRLAVVWSTTQLAIVVGHDLSNEAHKRTLYQSYSTHVDRNTSEVVSGILQKVEIISNGVLVPLQVAIGSVLTMAMVTAALVLVDPVIATISLVVLGGGYLVIARAFVGRLERNGRRVSQEQSKLLKVLQEGLGGIRDILIDGTQSVFLDEFRGPDLRMRQARGSNNVIQQAPRVLMDFVAMLLISMLAIVLSGRSGGITQGLPILGALALGGQRLLPLYQQCYAGMARVAGSRAMIVVTLEILEQPLPATFGLPDPSPLEFMNELECQELYYRYTEDGPWVIDGMDLKITAGTRVGLVGATGCGKSTLLDLLMGLLVPSQGVILVDGQQLEGSRLRAWQRSIAHVPQHIFLTDASLTENIAFGVPVEEIEMDRVYEAAHRAMITEFIEGESAGYATVAGERGSRLSGGQRQRIGIARALYKRASVLILDEATSALDNQMEQSVIGSLGSLNREITVVLVAHRLSTLKDCDVIVEMRDGRVVSTGTFQDLMQTSDTFREMALAVESKM